MIKAKTKWKIAKWLHTIEMIKKMTNFCQQKKPILNSKNGKTIRK